MCQSVAAIPTVAAKDWWVWVWVTTKEGLAREKPMRAPPQHLPNPDQAAAIHAQEPYEKTNPKRN